MRLGAGFAPETSIQPGQESLRETAATSRCLPSPMRSNVDSCGMLKKNAEVSVDGWNSNVITAACENVWIDLRFDIISENRRVALLGA